MIKASRTLTGCSSHRIRVKPQIPRKQQRQCVLPCQSLNNQHILNTEKLCARRQTACCSQTLPPRASVGGTEGRASQRARAGTGHLVTRRWRAWKGSVTTPSRKLTAPPLPVCDSPSPAGSPRSPSYAPLVGTSRLRLPGHPHRLGAQINFSVQNMHTQLSRQKAQHLAWAPPPPACNQL